MDKRLEKALEFANFNVTLNNQKRILKEKYQEDLIFYHAGSKFTVNSQLINFVSHMVDSNQDTLILIDDNDTPVEVNLSTFLNEIKNVYFTASNRYHTQYHKLIKNRSVSGLLKHD
jgi:hypothetical protein